MKPQYIFAAVFAVCLTLGILLPAIAQPAPAPLPIATVLPATTQPQATEVAQADRNTQPVVLEPTAVNPPAQDEPASAPAFAPPPEGYATPTPLASDPHIIPLTAARLPELQQFAASLAGSQPDQIAGIYVPGLLTARIVPQPAGDESFVSSGDLELTLYQTPANFGTVGLLAHNYLSGKSFFQFKPGQQIALIYGDGRMAFFKVSGVQAFQALSPHDIRSDFVDLSDPQSTLLSYSQVFDRVYTTPGQLVFQTCIEANGELSWGRLFILADPIEQPEISPN